MILIIPVDDRAEGGEARIVCWHQSQQYRQYETIKYESERTRRTKAETGVGRTRKKKKKKNSPGKPPLASTSFRSSRMWMGRPPSSTLFNCPIAASAIAGSAYVTNLSKASPCTRGDEVGRHENAQPAELF